MSEYTLDDRDARRCPLCGGMGILALHQDPGEDAVRGTIENPVLICPICDTEFRATGMTWMGAVDVRDMTDDEIEEYAKAVLERFGAMAAGHPADDAVS
jgi:ribosomal protein S27AE